MVGELYKTMSEPTKYDLVLAKINAGITGRDLFHPRGYANSKGFFFSMALLCLVFCMQIFMHRLRLENYSQLIDTSPIPDLVLPQSSPLLDSGALLTQFSDRELFMVMERPEPEARPTSKQPKGPGVQELAKDLLLLGIIEDEPMQALIESKRTRETYYVQPGDQILDLIVEAIQAGQVTLRYNEETTVLR
jgi:hypothetical protein